MESKENGGKEIKIVRRRAVVAVLFIAAGIATAFFVADGPAAELFAFFFMLVGGFFLIDSLLKIRHYKKTGEVGFRLDERLELNSLKASRKGFVVLVAFLSAMLVASAFGVFGNVPFPAVVGPALALGALVYFVSYIYYEKAGQ